MLSVTMANLSKENLWILRSFEILDTQNLITNIFLSSYLFILYCHSDSSELILFVYYFRKKM